MMVLFFLQREKNKKGLVNSEKFYVFKVSKVIDIFEFTSQIYLFFNNTLEIRGEEFF